MFYFYVVLGYFVALANPEMGNVIVCQAKENKMLEKKLKQLKTENDKWIKKK